MAEVVVTPGYPNMGIAAGVDPALKVNGPFELFAGERDIVTDQGLFSLPVVQHQVIMASHTEGAGGSAVTGWAPWDGSDGKELAVAAHAVPAGVSGPFYTGAYFNHEALVWPAAINTVEKRKRAFAHTSISIGRVL